MAVRPQDRYATASDFAQDLRQWMADEPVAVYREPFWERLNRCARRHRAWTFALAILAGLVLLATVAGMVVFNRQAAQEHTLRIRAEKAERIAENARLANLRSTAVFAANDVMAIGALKTLRAVGLHVPKDVAVIGFDDVSIASMVEPTLTTVRQPIERMGAMAVDLLLSLLQGSLEEGTEPHKIILPTELVIRNSCGSMPN